MTDGFVYVMGASELRNLVKIGWSDTPERRLRDLRTGSPFALVLLDRHPGRITLETAVQAEFAGLRVRGEWFDFGDRDPLPLISDAVHRLAGDVRADPRIAYVFDEPGLANVPKEAGLTPSDRILALHVHVPVRHGGALRWTRAKMAAYIGVSLRTVATAIECLVSAELLIEGEYHGRLVYYRVNPDRI